MYQPTLMRAAATMIAPVAGTTSTKLRSSHSCRLATSGPLRLRNAETTSPKLVVLMTAVRSWSMSRSLTAVCEGSSPA